jgi:hypothetical protein
MTSSTEFNVWNPCNTIPFYEAMAESTVQIYHLFVVDMIEEDGLIN